MTISKRGLLQAMAGSLLLATAGGRPASSASSGSQVSPEGEGDSHGHHDHGGGSMPDSWSGQEQIAFLAYPGFTALDLVGPHYMLGNLMGATTHIVAKTKDPVVSDMKLAVVPTQTFDECVRDLDIICVPGGTTGTLAAMEDPDTMAFIRDRGKRAKYVTSVCTGSLLLGAAGLLEGYKATSHWGARDTLKIFGAEPVDARVVVDRNRITGAGVTAGLDFGLTLVEKLRDRRYAEGLQLMAEYDPTPPFDSGTPDKASPENVALMNAMFTDFRTRAAETSKRVFESLR